MPNSIQQTASHYLQELRNYYERNYACIRGGMTQERRENIAATIGTVSRVAQLAMFQLVEWVPAAMSDVIIGQATNNSNLAYLGAGSHHTTLSDGKNVLKILRASRTWTEAERQEEAEKLTENYKLFSRYLGKFAVPQTIAVELHPFAPDERVVVTKQQLYRFSDTELFHPYKPVVDRDRLQELAEMYPWLPTDLHKLGQASQALLEDTGLLVDTSGLQNIVIADSGSEAARLICLDGNPLADGSPSDRYRIAGQISQLISLTDSRR